MAEDLELEATQAEPRTQTADRKKSVEFGQVAVIDTELCDSHAWEASCCVCILSIESKEQLELSAVGLMQALAKTPR